MAERVLRLTEYDLLRTSIVDGNVYACTDSRKLYQDVGQTRILLDAIQITTEKKRLYDTVPQSSRKYYVWETSELWLWQNAWIKLLGNPDYPEAYQYIDGDIYAVGGRGQNTFVDNNGMLGDGGVVVRDINRVIKGKLYIDDTNDNLIVSSFLGGGMKFLPNGNMEDTGALFLDTDGNGSGLHYNDMYNTNGELYVKYDETHRQEDPSIYENSTHTYKVWHEGNLDATPLINDEVLRKYYEAKNGRGNTLVDNSATSNGFKVNTNNNDLGSLSGFATYNYWNDKTPVLSEVFIQDQIDPLRNSRIMGVQNSDGTYCFYLTYDSDKPTNAKDISELNKLLNKGEIEQLINSKIRIAKIEKVDSDYSQYKIVDTELTRFLKDGFVILIRFLSDSTMRKIKININDQITYDVDDNITKNQQPLFFKSGNVYQFVINGSKLILLNNDLLASDEQYGNVMVTNVLSPVVESFTLINGNDINLDDPKYRIDGKFAFNGMIVNKSGFPKDESFSDKQAASYILDVKTSINPSEMNNFEQVLTNINENKVYKRSYNTAFYLKGEFEQGSIDGNGENEDSIIYVRQSDYHKLNPLQSYIVYTNLSKQIQFKIFEYDNFVKIAESSWRPANQAFLFNSNANSKYMRIEFRYSDNATKLEVADVEKADIKIGVNGYTTWEKVYPVEKDEFINSETIEIESDGWIKNVANNNYEYNVKRIFVNDKTLVEGNLDLNNRNKLDASYTESYNGGFKIITKLLPRDNFTINMTYQDTQEVK